MAYSSLSEEPLRGVEGKCYRVEANPFGASPYEGHEDRDWDEFAAWEHGASFAYRTGPDRIRELAQAVVARRLSLVRARQDPIFRKWYANLDEKYHEIYCGEPREARAAVRQVLVEIAEGKVCASEQETAWSFYLFESEEFLHEPLERLPLPPWAKDEYVMDGGPGSGFDAAFLVLEPGKTLGDLAEWLEGQGPKHKATRA